LRTRPPRPRTRLDSGARARAAAASALVLAIAGAAGGCRRSPPAAAPADPDAPAVRIGVADLDAIGRRVAATGRRVTLVNFWATWCGPCVDELPDLFAAVDAASDRSVALLLVSYDLNTPGAGLTAQTVVPLVRRFAAVHALRGDVLIYDGLTPELEERFGLAGPIPATIVVDAAGKVVARHFGPATRAQFAALIDEALAK
jgi:thiol-disulfide isomerase/thioredoxin